MENCVELVGTVAHNCHSKFKIIDHARRLQSPPSSTARRQRIYVIHEAAIFEVSAPPLLMAHCFYLSQINSAGVRQKNLLSYYFFLLPQRTRTMVCFHCKSTIVDKVSFP